MDKLDNLIEEWKYRESTIKSEQLRSTEDDQLINQVVNLLNGLKVNLKKLNELGEQHDYNKELKHNGFRSFEKVTILAIDRVKETLHSQSKSEQLNQTKVEPCLSFLKFINKIDTALLETYERNKTLIKEDVNQNRKEYDLLFDEKVTSDIFETYFLMKDDFKIYFDGHLAFYLTTQLQMLIQIVSSALIMLSNFPFSLFILFSKKKSVNALSDAIIESTVTWPGSVEVVNRPIVRSLVNLYATWNRKVQSHTIFLPKQQKWLLKTLDECNAAPTTELFYYRPEQEGYITKDLKNDGVRVQLIHHVSKPKEGIVMFHVHGGAFIYHSPDCHQNYLQHFAESIPNLFILSVDYKLREKYGKAHQDVLDAYLWLTSDSPDVIEVFGFKPKEIILCGDSAGSFLSFTLCKMLKDLQKYSYEHKLNEKIQIPKTIINFYGFITLNKLSPSYFFSFLESVVTLPTLRAGFGSLLFGCEQPQFTRRIFLPFLDEQEERWYSSTNSNRVELNNQFVEQIEKHPYLEPIDHVDFNDFQDIQLYLITSEFDVFLDANIELAKKWKGFVELKVFDNACHGFLQFGVVDSISMKAVESSIQIIKDAISRNRSSM